MVQLKLAGVYGRLDGVDVGVKKGGLEVVSDKFWENGGNAGGPPKVLQF